MKARVRATHPKEIEAFIRFEEALLEYLFANGHLSPAMRPLWVERLRLRKAVPGEEAFETHRQAANDCLEMLRDWGETEIAEANIFFARRGAPTIEKVRLYLHRNAPKKKQSRR